MSPAFWEGFRGFFFVALLVLAVFVAGSYIGWQRGYDNASGVIK